MWEADDNEFVAKGKEVHEEEKMRKADKTLPWPVVAQRIYVHNLSGRGDFPPKSSIAEEATLRLTSAVERVAKEGASETAYLT